MPKKPPKAPNLGDNLGLLDKSLFFLQSGGPDSSQWVSHPGGATNPVSHQPGSHLSRSVAACLWAACVGVPEMLTRVGRAEGEGAEVEGALCRSPCPSIPLLKAAAASAGHSGLAAAALWTFTASTESWINTPGVLPQQLLSVQSWILSLLLQLSRNEREGLFISSGNYLQRCTFLSPYPITRRYLEKYTYTNQIFALYCTESCLYLPNN